MFALLKLVPTSVWVGIAAGVAFICAVAWIDHRGYVRGKAEVQAEWDTSRAADAAEVNRLNKIARKAEQDNAARIAAIGDSHAQELADLEARRARDVADARSGALKLRVPNACRPAVGAGEVSAPVPAGNGATDGELPPEITGRLLDIANDADRNTLQLTACQQVVRSYLKTQEFP